MGWIPLLFAIGTVLILMVFPFLRRRPPWMPFRGATEGGDLLEKKEALLRAMKDIEFEYENGTLSPEDRDVLMADHRRRAAAILKRLDALGPGEPEAMERLEEEVASERKAQEAG